MQRVESGRLRGRRLLRLPRGVPGLRPTAARVRDAIFNRLRAEVPGARVLDLFGGSGAMSIEAISRGADRATVIELSGRVAKHLQAQAEALGVAEQVRVVKADALKYLGQPAQPYDLVIVDPPFAKPDIFDAITAALVTGWLAEDAIVVCERELVRGKSRDVAWPDALTLEATKNYGQAVVEYLRYAPHSSEPSHDD
ncbi:MAG: 16S rRNA (guanine(966)-N(2))-methyltransferase RsmD [Myxococcota bacterium]